MTAATPSIPPSWQKGCPVANQYVVVAPAAERFLLRIRLDDECWIWTAAKTGGGYGRFSVGGKNQYIHRWAFEHFKRRLLAGEEIDHTCRNTACGNPKHLEAVSGRINVLRGCGITAKNAEKTHCPRGHPYSLENTYVEPGRHRRCRICNRSRLQRRRDRRRIEEAMKP